MFSLAMMRWVLGLLSRTFCLARSLSGQLGAALSRGRSAHVSRAQTLPHPWMYLDYDMTNAGGRPSDARPEFAARPDPLRSAFRLLRRLAGLPEPCPARIATAPRQPTRQARN